MACRSHLTQNCFIWPMQAYFSTNLSLNLSHPLHSLTFLPQPSPHMCVLPVHIVRHLFLSPGQNLHFTGKDPKCADSNWLPTSHQWDQEAGQHYQPGNAIFISYQYNRSLSSLSSWEDHRFLGNSLGTICQWKHRVWRCYNNEPNNPVEKWWWCYCYLILF